MIAGANDASYVFTRSAAVWTEEDILTGSIGENFGASVDVVGDDAIVGEQSDDAPLSNSGSAHVFTRTGSTWTLQQKLVPSDPASNGSFGYSVAIDGDYALVRRFGGTGGPGMYAFSRSGSTWTQDQKLSILGTGIPTTAMDGARAIYGVNLGGGIGGAQLLHFGSDIGDSCVTNDDCANEICIEGVCCATDCSTSTCFSCVDVNTSAGDGTCAPVLAGNDPLVDCPANNTCDGAGVCKLVNGQTCAAGSECALANCIDTVCCENVCGGLCDACSMAKTGVADGTCAPVSAGTDPDDDCTNGVCDGGSACDWDNGVACGGDDECVSVHCADGVCCDAACDQTCEACVLSKSGAADGMCTPIPANADPDTECPGQACDGGGACKSLIGDVCAVGGDCISTFCADGFCCGSACGATCQACSNAKTGLADGTCANVTINTDPDDECTNGACDGGACKLDLGQTCAQTSDCLSNFCIDSVCCDTGCGGLCQACTQAITGVSDGTCSGVANTTDPDNECTNGACDGSGACDWDNGVACGGNDECLSGFCVDGVCCDGACTPACEACTAIFTGGTDGICADVSIGVTHGLCQPPEQACDGGGVCKFTLGEPCSLGTDCVSGNCIDGFCCDTACGAECEACSQAKTGVSNGTCAAVTSMTDPDEECAAGACDGGACRQDQGELCVDVSGCLRATAWTVCAAT